MDLRKPSAKFNPDSQHRISLPTKVSRKPSLSSAPNVFCAVCQRSFCAAYAFYGSLVPPLRQHVSPEHGLYLFHVCIFSHTTELGTEPAVGLFVDWVISYGLKSLPGFEVLNPFHSPKVWMAVRIKPRGDEVFKLFTDIRFFFFFLRAPSWFELWKSWLLFWYLLCSVPPSLFTWERAGERQQRDEARLRRSENMARSWLLL